MPALTPENDAIRARNVTASEVGALMGPHPYTDPLRIYARLTGSPDYIKPERTQAMALGVYFEPYIARYAASHLGLRLRANKRTIQHPTHPLAATPDYIVLRPKGSDWYSRMLVEVKLSSIMYGWDESGLAPHIEWQARAQLACTDRDICIVAALVGSAFYSVPVVRDMQKERDMLEAVDKFMARVALGYPPEPIIPQLRKIVVSG